MIHIDHKEGKMRAEGTFPDLCVEAEILLSCLLRDIEETMGKKDAMKLFSQIVIRAVTCDYRGSKLDASQLGTILNALKEKDDGKDKDQSGK